MFPGPKESFTGPVWSARTSGAGRTGPAEMVPVGRGPPAQSADSVRCRLLRAGETDYTLCYTGPHLVEVKQLHGTVARILVENG